jgi:hypothetical protein
VAGADLLSGKRKSCGHSKTKHDEKLIGRTFGSWTIIGPSKTTQDKTGKNRILWLCKCSCGFEKFMYLGAVLAGNTSKCRTCGYKFTPRKGYGIASHNIILGSYKRTAAARGLIWDISDIEFDVITKRDCFYCGSKPSNEYAANRKTGSFVYNGIDRVDNTRGYETDNVVPCCKVCNRAKSAMSQEDFLDWIKRVVQHSEDSRQSR